MKALSVDVVPEGRWRLEVKLDGYRAVAFKSGGTVHKTHLTLDENGLKTCES